MTSVKPQNFSDSIFVCVELLHLSNNQRLSSSFKNPVPYTEQLMTIAIFSYEHERVYAIGLYYVVSRIIPSTDMRCDLGGNHLSSPIYAKLCNVRM